MVSTMTRGRNRYQNSKNHDGESVPIQTGQEEEIASHHAQVPKKEYLKRRKA
jgi:hypothetical protein